MRADRLMRLIVLLQRHRRVPAARLAEWLEVSERTILRDMEALSASGVPVYTEQGRGGGCVLLDGFTTDASGLTSKEAQALFAWASQDSATELGFGPDLSGALAKIAATASASVVSDAEALGAVLMSDRRRWFADAETVPALPVLRQAAQQRCRVRIAYNSPGATAPRTRTIDPHGLVDQSGRWYLLASHRGRLRTYRVSRIASVTPLDQPVLVELDRPLAQVWDELRSRFESKISNGLVIEVDVAPGIAGAFLPIATSQLIPGTKPEHVSGDRWRLQVRARRQALALVLAWAPDVVLVTPDDLVAELRRSIEALVAIYSPR